MSEGSWDGAPRLAAMLRRPFVWACALALGLGLRAFYPVLASDRARSLSVESEEFFFQPNEAAGLPVLVLSIWLFYRRSHYRDLLGGGGATLRAIAVFAVSAAIFGWGAHTGADDLQILSLIGVLAATVSLLGGMPGLRAYWLPILFVGFALPISPVLIGATMFPIQLVTAQISGAILNGIGFEAVVQGDQILRPANTFVVIETCSGMRTMVTLSMLTVLLIDLFERRGWHAAILFALAPIVGFGVNALRVVTLVLNPHSSIHSVHNLQGIVMLLVGLIALYLIDGRLERILDSRDPNLDPGDYGEAAGARASERRRTIEVLGVVGVLTAMLTIGASVPKWNGAHGLAEKPGALLERVFGEDPLPPLQVDYNFRGSVAYLASARHRVLVDGELVEIFLGVANEQRRDLSVLTRRLAWPASGFAPVDESFVAFGPDRSRGSVGPDDVGRMGRPPVRRMVLRRGRESVLSYSWIERRRSLPEEWFRQSTALDRSSAMRPYRMLAIRLVTGLGSEGDATNESEDRLRRVWERLEPELVGYAPSRLGGGE